MAIYNTNFTNVVKNNSGTVLNGEVLLSDNNNRVKTLIGKTRTLNYPFGSAVVDGVGVDAINASVAVPFSNSRSLVKRTTISLANKPSSMLITAGTYDPELRNSIHPITTYRTRLQSEAYRNNQYNIYTGKYNTGYPDNTLDSFGDDNAANPTRSNPGKLFYKHYRLITKQNYPSKTG